MRTFARCMVVVVVGSCVAGTTGCAPQTEHHPAPETAPVVVQRGPSPEYVQRAVLGALVRPVFFGDLLEQQLMGPYSFELLSRRRQRMYFSIPEGNADHEALARFLRDPHDISVCGPKELARIPVGKTVYQTSLANFYVDPDLLLEFPFRRVVYSITPAEIAESIANRYIHGGYKYVLIDRRHDEQTIMVNHGGFVSRQGVPSLMRLAHDLTKNSRTREEKIQRLLDFVSMEIEYDHSSSSLWSIELMRRAQETVISRLGDCANKACLFASLLEQLGEPYLLLYFPEHLAVGVHRDAFPARNGLSFHARGQEWILCETTCSGFRIGETLICLINIESTLNFYQPSDDMRRLIHAKTGEYMPFD